MNKKQRSEQPQYTPRVRTGMNANDPRDRKFMAWKLRYIAQAIDGFRANRGKTDRLFLTRRSVIWEFPSVRKAMIFYKMVRLLCAEDIDRGVLEVRRRIVRLSRS